MKTLLFDFSRVLLHPKDIHYTGSLNELYRTSLRKKINFFEIFMLNTPLLTFLQSMKQTYSLYLLTSEIIQNAPEIRDRLHNIFQAVYSAQDFKLSKKDPRIYTLITEILHVDASEITFIDDTIENINAARNAGLQTIQYRTNASLMEQLPKV